MQAKAEKSWEANKLAKRNARPPETAVHDVSTTLHRQKAAQAKEQAKLVELEAAAKAAAEAVEQAKQKAIKRQEDIDRLQAEYDQELARLVQTKDSVTHLQKSLRDSNAHSGGHRRAQRRRERAARHGAHGPGGGQSLHAVVGRPPRRRERGQEAEVRGVRRARAPGFATSSGTSTRPAALAANRRPQARDLSIHPLPRFWLGKDFQFVSLVKKQPGQLPRPTPQGGNLDS